MVNFFKNMKKKKKIILLCSAMAFIFALMIGGYFFYISNKDSKLLGEFTLKSFKQDVSNSNSLNLLEFEGSSNAINYKVYIYNNKNKLLKEVETKETSVVLNDLTVPYNDEVTIKVVAFDKNGNKMKSSNELQVVWELPCLEEKEINDIGVDEDLSVRINIDEDNMKDYYLVLTKNEEEIVKLEVDSSKMIIPNSYYKDKLGKYKVSLVINDLELSSYEFNVGLPEIGEVYIDSIKHNSTIPWDDFVIAFSGGENADLYEICIFKDNKMIFFKQTGEMRYTMDISKLEENNTYVLKVMAYNKIDNTINNQKVLSFKTGSKQKLSAVTSNYTSGNVYIGKSVTLSNNIDESVIYYTTDGSVPNSSSIKYENPIEISKDVVIKAIAIKKNYYDSDISEFNYKAVVKPLSVYISPSLQTENKGVQSVGYTNESVIMNRIADVVVSGLKAKNIVVYRSSADMDINDVIKDSKNKDVDLHLALHSNAYDTKIYGIETYAYSKNSKIAPLASKIQIGLESIYNRTNPRKIMYCTETGNILKEVNPNNVNNGILIEVAYHDNVEDATWIVNNINNIGNKLVDVIATYYGK